MDTMTTEPCAHALKIGCDAPDGHASTAGFARAETAKRLLTDVRALAPGIASRAAEIEAGRMAEGALDALVALANTGRQQRALRNLAAATAAARPARRGAARRRTAKTLRRRRQAAPGQPAER